MPSFVTPKKNAAFTMYVGLVDQANTKLLKANPTLAAGDVKVSIDGGAFANIATLPVVTPAAGRAVKVDLSAAEMNGDNIVVQFVDAAGAEWCDAHINIQTSARQIDDLAFPVTSGRGINVDASNAVLIQTGMKKNQALSSFAFLMTDSTTHNPVTGKTVTATRSIDGGAFGAGTLGAVTELSNGMYVVNIPAADRNGNVVTYRFTAAGCDDLFVSHILEP